MRILIIQMNIIININNYVLLKKITLVFLNKIFIEFNFL